MKDLQHHIRNATTNIEGLFYHLDKATRLKVAAQLKRIEQALVLYKMRVGGKKMLPILEILRIEESESGTIGVLRINKQILGVTLEPEDQLNKIDRSSIPAQQYICRRVTRPRFDETFEIMNVPGRTDVLFHAGNFVSDTAGCVILAEHVGKLRGQRAVLNSGKTFSRFMAELLGYDKAHLTIVECY